MIIFAHFQPVPFNRHSIQDSGKRSNAIAINPKLTFQITFNRQYNPF